MGLAMPARSGALATTLLGLSAAVVSVVFVSSLDHLSAVSVHVCYGLLLLLGAGLSSWHRVRLARRHSEAQTDAARADVLLGGLSEAVVVLSFCAEPHSKGLQVRYVNRAARSVYGDAGGGLDSLCPRAAWPALHEAVTQARSSGQPQRAEDHSPAVNGGQHQGARWWLHQVIPLPDGVAICSQETTAAHQNLQALRDREAFYRTLVDSLPLGVFARSSRPRTAGQYVVWNQAAADVMQLPADMVLGRTASELMPAEIVRQADTLDMAVIREPRVHRFSGLILATPAGERVVDMVKCPVYGRDGEIDHILSIAQDVTAQRHAEAQLRLAARVLEETGDAVVVSDAVDRIVTVNPAFLNLTGLKESEVLGRSAELVGLPPLRESHLPHITTTLASGQRWHGESRQVCHDGRSLDIWLSVSTLRNEANRITQHIRLFSDISVLKAQQRELVEQARHDSLTGLPNRRAFGERLRQAMARTQRRPQALAVLFVDLDGFKAVNDRHGHAAGDQILIEVAHRLLECVRTTDTVCRLAGDEFTVILEGAGLPEDVTRVGERMIERLSQPHTVGDDCVVCTPSIGAAFQHASDSPDSVCQRADEAMYQAKRAGKGRLHLAPCTDEPASKCQKAAI